MNSLSTLDPNDRRPLKRADLVELIREHHALRDKIWKRLLSRTHGRGTLHRIVGHYDVCTLAELEAFGTEQIIEEDGWGDALNAAMKGRKLPSTLRRDFYILTRARRRIVNANLGLVSRIIRRYCHLENYADLFQEGAIGCIRAINTFDPDLGYAFTTYATGWIRHYAHRHVHNRRHTIRVPVHVQEKMRKGVQSQTTQLGVAAQTIYSMDYVSPDGIPFDVADGNSLTAVSDDVCEGEWLRRLIEQTFQRRDMWRHIVLEYYGFEGNGRTLQSIGNEHGLSRERIRQLLVLALRELRPKLDVDRKPYELMTDAPRR